MQEIEQEAARQARNSYMRMYRAKNRERIKAINDRYWAKRAQREIEEVMEDAQAANSTE